ncbi:MAG: acetyl-coenzyme A synthetase N-terminal domain-containing protein, partial [Solirubrobacterales bacterium]
MAEDREGEIDVLMETERTFPPPEEFAEQANASDPEIYERAASDREGWWASWAEKLDWTRPWDEVCDWSEPPFAKWFVGG